MEVMKTERTVRCISKEDETEKGYDDRNRRKLLLVVAIDEPSGRGRNQGILHNSTEHAILSNCETELLPDCQLKSHD